jgi:hypothetical protein
MIDMLSDKITEIYEFIVNKAISVVGTNVEKEDLTGKINFASIYAQSEDEYERLSRELKLNGVVFDKQKTGTYYKLNQPIMIKDNLITICRVRKFDKNIHERGYCDFQVNNYEEFKCKYSQQKHFSLIFNQHGIEMVELLVPDSNIRIYFPNTWS